MYLVGDRINLPSPSGGDVLGTVALVEEQVGGNVAYVVNTDDNMIVIRLSEDEQETSFIDDITVDFN